MQLIGTYGVQMTVTFLVAMAFWTLKVSMSETDTIAWYRGNLVRIGIALASFWLMAVALVVVPNISLLLGNLGFNADQSAASIALVITGFIIKKSNANNPASGAVSDITTGATGE